MGKRVYLGSFILTLAICGFIFTFQNCTKYGADIQTISEASQGKVLLRGEVGLWRGTESLSDICSTDQESFENPNYKYKLSRFLVSPESCNSSSSLLGRVTGSVDFRRDDGSTVQASIKNADGHMCFRCSPTSCKSENRLEGSNICFVQWKKANENGNFADGDRCIKNLNPFNTNNITSGSDLSSQTFKCLEKANGVAGVCPVSLNTSPSQPISCPYPNVTSREDPGLVSGVYVIADSLHGCSCNPAPTTTTTSTTLPSSQGTTTTIPGSGDSSKVVNCFSNTLISPNETDVMGGAPLVFFTGGLNQVKAIDGASPRLWLSQNFGFTIMGLNDPEYPSLPTHQSMISNGGAGGPILKTGDGQSTVMGVSLSDDGKRVVMGWKDLPDNTLILAENAYPPYKMAGQLPGSRPKAVAAIKTAKGKYLGFSFSSEGFAVGDITVPVPADSQNYTPPVYNNYEIGTLTTESVQSSGKFLAVLNNWRKMTLYDAANDFSGSQILSSLRKKEVTPADFKFSEGAYFSSFTILPDPSQAGSVIVFASSQDSSQNAQVLGALLWKANGDIVAAPPVSAPAPYQGVNVREEYLAVNSAVVNNQAMAFFLRIILGDNGETIQRALVNIGFSSAPRLNVKITKFSESVPGPRNLTSLTRGSSIHLYYTDLNKLYNFKLQCSEN